MIPDWQCDQYKRMRRALQAHLTRTIYSDAQGEPPARTWGQDVAAWACGVDSLYSEAALPFDASLLSAMADAEFARLRDWCLALLRANDYALSERHGDDKCAK
jgi:hypothetical protein